MTKVFQLGRSTIQDPAALEYEWVKNHREKHPDDDIVASIQHCFGGSEETAELFYQVAMGEATRNDLIRHLEKTEWEH